VLGTVILVIGSYSLIRWIFIFFPGLS
jgi:hypothetical protein